MRILVFANEHKPEAREALEAFRADGNHASFRNPQYFDGSIDECDAAYFDLSWECSAKVMDAYEAKGVAVHELFAKPAKAAKVVEPVAEAAGVVPAIKARFGKK